jgi:hypothetical protein
MRRKWTAVVPKRRVNCSPTPKGVAARVSRLGKPLPLLAAVLVPVLGLGLYLHFGAATRSS